MNTSVGLDLNEDGKISGHEEWFHGDQIIRIAGSAYEIESIAPDGSSITLLPSKLTIPELGKPMPSVPIATADGNRISWCGKRPLILYLWESRSRSSIEKITNLKAMANEFKARLILFCVDGQSTLKDVQRIMKDQGIPSLNTIANGMGRKDAVWKMLGSMPSVGMTVPLIAIVDGDGILRFAGTGDSALKMSRKVLTDLSSKE